MVQQRTSGMALGLLLSILAIIFGGVGISQTGRDAYLKGRGMAIAGLVLGIVAIVLWIIVFLLIGWAFWSSSSVIYY